MEEKIRRMAKEFDEIADHLMRLARQCWDLERLFIHMADVLHEDLSKKGEEKPP